jgi:hypothetical protein
VKQLRKISYLQLVYDVGKQNFAVLSLYHTKVFDGIPPYCSILDDHVRCCSMWWRVFHHHFQLESKLKLESVSLHLFGHPSLTRSLVDGRGLCPTNINSDPENESSTGRGSNGTQNGCLTTSKRRLIDTPVDSVVPWDRSHVKRSHRRSVCNFSIAHGGSHRKHQATTHESHRVWTAEPVQQSYGLKGYGTCYKFTNCLFVHGGGIPKLFTNRHVQNLWQRVSSKTGFIWVRREIFRAPDVSGLDCATTYFAFSGAFDTCWLDWVAASGMYERISLRIYIVCHYF